jgi:hypothetical protein
MFGGNKKFEIGFQAGSKVLGRYEIPQSGSPSGVHIYDNEDEIFGSDETENLDGLSAEKKNQQVVLVREGDGIRFYTVSDDISTFKVQLYLDGSLLGTVEHQLKAEDDFKRLIAAVEGFVAGDAPPAIRAWQNWPIITLPEPPTLTSLSENQLSETLSAAPAAVASEVASTSSLRDPRFFLAFVTRVHQVATQQQWTSFAAQLSAIGYDTNAALAAAAAPPPGNNQAAAAGGSIYPGPGALKTELNLPAEIRNRGMVSRVVIYWVKRAMKTQVAAGEGIVFGLWDGVKGDAEGFVDMFRTLGQVFSSPVKTASELYHAFKSLKDLTFDQIKAKVQDLFDSFLTNQQQRMEWVLEGESSDPVYLGTYMGGYLGGYIGEQVLVTIGTAGLSKGKYIARAITEGKALLTGLNLTQKIPRNFNQVFSRFVRTADEGRGVSLFSNRCTLGNCFAPGTLVLMADGRRKAIENVERGDWIISDDPFDDEPPKSCKVEWLIRSRADRLYSIDWDRDGDGVSDGRLQVTSEHPVYTVEHGWIEAQKITSGDHLQTRDQRTVTVAANHAWIAPTETYNLDVGDPNTYFVGDGTTWLLVHNAEFDMVPFRPLNPPNQNHHGIMNAWLKDHFPTTYLGREFHDDFPCIELSGPNHLKATEIERNFRISRGLPPYGSASWKDVSPQDVIKVGKDALRAAGVPDSDRVFHRLLNTSNGWLRNNLHLWRCP